MNRQLFTVAFIVLGGLLCGCQNTVDTVANRQTDMQRRQVDTSRISTDSFIKRRLKIIRVDKVMRPDGLLQVQVTALNNRTGFFYELGSWFMNDNPYKIAYRFSWLDQNGMEVKTAASTWIPMTVIPGDSIRLQAVAPNPRCHDFILSLKEE